jgi:hypothetical protein
VRNFSSIVVPLVRDVLHFRIRLFGRVDNLLLLLLNLLLLTLFVVIVVVVEIVIIMADEDMPGLL